MGAEPSAPQINTANIAAIITDAKISAARRPEGLFPAGKRALLVFNALYLPLLKHLLQFVLVGAVGHSNLFGNNTVAGKALKAFVHGSHTGGHI